MGLTKDHIGELVRVVDERNTEGINDFRGLDINKKFICTKANTAGLDESKYKVVRSNRFVFSGMQTGRDRCVRIGMSRECDPFIVSPAYTTFDVVSDRVLPAYLFMLFLSPEMDRRGWFCSDGSIRANLDWDVFCDIEVTLPSIEVQRKYVSVYESMLANQCSYEQGLDNLRLSLDASYDHCKHDCPTIKLGELLTEVDVRNDSNLPAEPMGVTLNQRFQPSRGQIEKRERYKQVAPGQIVVNLIHVGRDAAFPIAKNDTNEILLVSPDYYVFEPKDIDTARYLMGWISRYEVGRYGWFICDVDVRGRLNIEKFFEMSIPYPPKKTLRAVAGLQAAFKTRSDINERLKSQLKEIAPVLIRGSIEEASR